MPQCRHVERRGSDVDSRNSDCETTAVNINNNVNIPRHSGCSINEHL